MAGVDVDELDGDGDVVDEPDGEGDDDWPHGLDASGPTEKGSDDPDVPGRPGPPGPGPLLDPVPLGLGFVLPASLLDSEQPEDVPLPVESPPPLHAKPASEDERASKIESESARFMVCLLRELSRSPAKTDGAGDRRTKSDVRRPGPHFTVLVAQPTVTSRSAAASARAAAQVVGQRTIRCGASGAS